MVPCPTQILLAWLSETPRSRKVATVKRTSDFSNTDGEGTARFDDHKKMIFFGSVDRRKVLMMFEVSLIKLYMILATYRPNVRKQDNKNMEHTVAARAPYNHSGRSEESFRWPPGVDWCVK